MFIGRCGFPDAKRCHSTMNHNVPVIMGLTSNNGQYNDLFALPVDSRGVSPQFLQRVKLTCGGIENMNDEIAIVLDDPSAGFVPFNADSAITKLRELGIDIFGDGMHLSAT